MKTPRLIPAFFLVLFFASIAGAEPLSVFVSIPPQKYFVEQIGGDHVRVFVMVQPGASPATYEPKPRQMAKLSRADVYFAIGVPFESVWLDTFQRMHPNLRIVFTDKGVEKLPMGGHSHETGHHGHHGHGEEILDPHIWLSPPLVKQQAKEILTALLKIDPVHAPAYRRNHHHFINALEELDTRIRTILSGVQKKTFMVFHPSWGYFARTYGLEQIAIEVEGKDPGPRELQNIIAKAEEEKIGVIFVQAQFSDKSAQVIARSLQAGVVVLDPLAPDWAENLLQVAAALKKAK